MRFAGMILKVYQPVSETRNRPAPSRWRFFRFRGGETRRPASRVQTEALQTHATIPAMACPFFEPGNRLEDPPAASGPPPLGDWYRGVCRSARPGPASLPLLLCNYGYARGACVRFPLASDAPDAVRFSMVTAPGGDPQVQFALEKDHYPAGHGVLSPPFAADENPSVLHAQVLAFWSACRRRLIHRS